MFRKYALKLKVKGNVATYSQMTRKKCVCDPILYVIVNVANINLGNLEEKGIRKFSILATLLQIGNYFIINKKPRFP